MPEEHKDTRASDESSRTVVGHFPDRKMAELAAQAALKSGFGVQVVDRTTVKVQAEHVEHTGEAEGILGAYGASNLPAVRSSSPDTRDGSGPQHIRTERGGRLELVEEELQPRQEPVVAGEVRIRKDVVKETVTINVPVEREELVIERVPVERRMEDQAADDKPTDPLVQALSARLREMQPGDVVRIPIVEQQVVVDTQPVVKSELVIGKRLAHEVQHFTERVRREVAHVDRRGDVRAAEKEEQS